MGHVQIARCYQMWLFVLFVLTPLATGGCTSYLICLQASAPHPSMPIGARTPAPGQFASSPRAPSMSHFGGSRAPERSMAAAQGFNAVPGTAPAPLGQGFGPPGAPARFARSPGDPTGANALYDSSHGLGGKPAALPASPVGYGAAYSPSDPCEAYRQRTSFVCTAASLPSMLPDTSWPSLSQSCTAIDCFMVNRKLH